MKRGSFAGAQGAHPTRGQHDQLVFELMFSVHLIIFESTFDQVLEVVVSIADCVFVDSACLYGRAADETGFGHRGATCPLIPP